MPSLLGFTSIIMSEHKHACLYNEKNIYVNHNGCFKLTKSFFKHMNLSGIMVQSTKLRPICRRQVHVTYTDSTENKEKA